MIKENHFSYILHIITLKVLLNLAECTVFKIAREKNCPSNHIFLTKRSKEFKVHPKSVQQKQTTTKSGLTLTGLARGFAAWSTMLKTTEHTERSK